MRSRVHALHECFHDLLLPDLQILQCFLALLQLPRSLLRLSVVFRYNTPLKLTDLMDFSLKPGMNVALLFSDPQEKDRKQDQINACQQEQEPGQPISYSCDRGNADDYR